ncbi:MAG: acetate/propionate family kinase [Candidatus Limnocylindria bacterium]
MTDPAGRILVLNAGSSTLKAAVLDGRGADPGDARLELAALATATLRWTDHDGVAGTLERALADAGVADPAGLSGVGHRLVHGGDVFVRPTIVDDGVLAALDDLVPLAPLHQPAAVATIRAMRDRAPGLLQVACFDTAFHAELPETDRIYPVPAAWQDELALRRYGFHGLSVDWSVRRAAALLGRPVADLRLVVAHLGAGASVTAVDGGRSVHTSMGYTPLEGLVMATRAGSIDPGIVTAMARRGHAPEALEADLQQRSGLVALAGTGDMRAILARVAEGDPAASRALDVFVDRAAAAIAAAGTRLPSIDAVVFTGGIGEAAPLVRMRLAARLGVIGIEPLDEPRQDSREDGILGGDRRPVVVRVAAREDRVIAAAVLDSLEPSAGG